MTDERFRAFPADYQSIKGICDYVVSAAESVGMSSDDLFQVELAVDEACTNIVEHAYGGLPVGEIHVDWNVEHREGDRYFVVRICDTGQPFVPDSVEQPLRRPEVDALKVGGLGIHFMRNLMDLVIFNFMPDCNELLMYKKVRKETS